jgi:hypothetical protein
MTLLQRPFFTAKNLKDFLPVSKKSSRSSLLRGEIDLFAAD